MILDLSVIVAESMAQDPLSGSLFLFRNRQRRILKCLYWDRNGFCLWQKRLGRDRFPWPQSTEEELRMLLSGIDFFAAHRELSYSSVR